MIGIYSITNNVDMKCYIGQSTNISKRFQDHKYKLRQGRHPNEHLQRAWWRDGEENFSFDILEECSADELDNKEIFYIKYYKSNDRDFGYNKDEGGNSYRIVSEETRKKISENLMGHKITPEQIEKLRQSHLGKHLSEEAKQRLSEFNKGKTLSEEHRRKIGEAQKGKKVSEETRKKLSESHKGKKWSEEHHMKIKEYYKTHKGNSYGRKMSEEECKKLSERMKGHIPWNKGRKMTPEELKKHSEVRKGKPQLKQRKIVVNLDSGAVYESVTIAIQTTGIKHISQAATGLRNTAGGYRWAYYEDIMQTAK